MTTTRAARGRRTPRVSGDERERAILETAERLLGERPLGQVSVDDLARGAGISRPTFYFYFPSKDAVVLTLIDRIVEQADRGREASLASQGDPVESWRESIEIMFATFAEHGPVVRAVTDLGISNPEARALWSRVMEGWVTHVAARIEAEVARGAADLDDVEPRELAIALVQMAERVMHAIFIDEAPAVSRDQAVKVIDRIWRSSIYSR